MALSAPNDAFYLFDPENKTEPTYLSDKYVPLIGGLVGFLTPIAHNFTKRRPLYAGLPLIAVGAAVGTGIGFWIENRNQLYAAEQEAIYRHYISLHPEDFKPQERIKVGDMFKPWVPIR